MDTFDKLQRSIKDKMRKIIKLLTCRVGSKLMDSGTMNIDDISFHDSLILKVTEDSKKQSLDFLLDFPVDWENNIYEKRTLRFEDVVFYNVDEIPFAGFPAILNIGNSEKIIKKYGEGRNEMKVERIRVKIETNAGERIVEFSKCKFIKR